MLRTESKHRDRAGISRPTGQETGSGGPAGDGSRDGFSLIEVLVILLLLAAMSLMSLTFINQLEGFQSVNQDAPYRDEADNAVRHIARTLKQALPLPLDAADGQRQIFLVGEPHSVTFVIQTRAGLAESALRTTGIRLDAQGSGGTLLQSMSFRRPDRDHGAVVAEDFEILRGGSEFNLGYLLFDRTGSPVWKSAWEKEGLLPLAVSIDLAIERDGKTYRASSVITLPASKSVDYYFDCPGTNDTFRFDELAEQSICRARLARSGRVPDYCSCDTAAR